MRLCLILALLLAPAWAQLPQVCQVRGEAAFSPDGHFLAVPAGTAKKPGFRLWDVPARKVVRFVPIPLTHPLGVAVTRDGTLATSSNDAEHTIAVEVWGEERKYSHQESGNILDFHVQWSPDGRQLASGRWGRMDLGRGLLVWSPEGETRHEVWFLGWTADNRLYCQENLETLSVRLPTRPEPVATVRLPGRPLSYSYSDRAGNLRCPSEVEPYEDVYSPDLKLLREAVAARRFRLGATDLKLQTVGQPKLTTGKGKVLAFWPTLHASAVSPDEKLLALVLPDQVLLVDLPATAKQQRLVLAK